MVRTYIDSCVLIAAFQGKDERAAQAIEVIGDPNRTLITSDYVRLETLPKPLFTRHEDEAEFMQAFFDQVDERIPSGDPVTSVSVDLAAKYDLKPLDALHIGTALHGKAEEFVTLERPSKPLGRISEIRIRFLNETS